MLKILHAADLHLDSPFSGLSPDRAAQRREEQRALVQRLADLAIQEQVDLVLLAGDLWDSGRLYRETAPRLAQELGRIPAPVFIAPGNHDPFDAGSPYALPIWPDNVHIFSSPRTEAVLLNELNCVVYGAAFTGEQRDDPPLADFRVPKDGRMHLMVLHGNTQGSGYAPIAPVNIAQSGLDYLALGHIHQYSGLQQSGNTFWAYPGCPEGRGFDELGEKGVMLLEVEPGHTSGHFATLSSRQYQILPVDLTDCADPVQSVLDALPADTQRDIFRIRLCGEYRLSPADLIRLEQTLAPRFWSLELQDHTRPPQDLWSRTEEDSLTGLFLRNMAQLCAASPEDETLQLAVRFGLAALENGEDVSP